MSVRIRIGRDVDYVAAALETLLAVALLGAIILNFANVVSRYLADFTIEGSDEIEIYILIWIAFLGAALVTWRGLHLRMDVLIKLAGARVRQIVTIAEVIVTLATASFVAYQSFLYVRRIYALGAVSDIAQLPTWIPHSAVVVSLVLTVVCLILRVWVRWEPAQESDAGEDSARESRP
jgi:TRAP-type C4-dicarboxylate transport system permease small subunit